MLCPCRYITSDCDADANVFTTHNYTATVAEAVRDVLRAGTDVDCGRFVQTNAQGALDNKTITMDDIDTRLNMLFAVRMRLGQFLSLMDHCPCMPYALVMVRNHAFTVRKYRKCGNAVNMMGLIDEF